MLLIHFVCHQQMDGKRVLSFVVPLVSLFVITLIIDGEQFVDLILEISPLALALIVLISIIRPFAGGLRASITFNDLGKLSIIDATKGYVLSMYGSIFLPSAIGGDLLRIEHMSRVSGESRNVSLTVAGAERGAGLLSLIAITIVFSLLVENQLADFREMSLLLFSLSSIGVMILLISRKTKPESFIGKMLVPLAKLSNPFSIMKVFSLSLFFQLFTLSVPIVVAYALGGLEIALAIGLVTPLVAIISTIPISIGGLGLREASFVGMGAIVGVSSEIAFLCGISLSSSLVLSGIPGVFFQHELITRSGKSESE